MAANDLAWRRHDHQSREHSALRRNEFSDAFAAEREHFIELRVGKCRFFPGTLHFHKFAILRRYQIEIDSDCFVFFIIQIDDCVPIENAGAYCRY